MSYDPCPEGKDGVTDLGHGVRIRFTGDGHGTIVGLIESHPRPDTGERCSGAITFDVPEAARFDPAGGPRPKWRVESMEPLTLSPSLLCRTCGHHGFIRAGRWVPA